MHSIFGVAQPLEQHVVGAEQTTSYSAKIKRPSRDVISISFLPAEKKLLAFLICQSMHDSAKRFLLWEAADRQQRVLRLCLRA